jgi:hypothetical protein
MKLESLTPEQKARLPEIKEEWTRIGYCTDPIDREAAVAAARVCYEKANIVNPDLNLTFPEKHVFVGSPQAAKAYMDEHHPNVTDRSYAWGSMDAGWLSFYAAMGEFGIDVSLLDGLFEMAKVAGWWMPFDEMILFVDRPSEIIMDYSQDPDGRLHCETGPAVKYRDGNAYYLIDGVLLNEQIVMHPEDQPLEYIQEEPNEEVKRIRVQRYGWGKYLAAIGAEKLDERENPIEGTYETLYKTDDHTVLACACPSTAKVFWLEVDPECSNCHEAQLYLSGGLFNRIIAAS